jgi:hypothetical protein
MKLSIAEPRNVSDSMRFSRESFSNEIDESDSQFEKHDEQRDSAFRGMMIDVIGRHGPLAGESRRRHRG